MLFVEADDLLKRLIGEEYTRNPVYGIRKMVVYLGRRGHRGRLYYNCGTALEEPQTQRRAQPGRRRR